MIDKILAVGTDNINVFLREIFKEKEIILSNSYQDTIKSMYENVFSLDLIIINLEMDKGMVLLSKIIEVNKSIPVIAVVKEGDIKKAKEAISIGAVDFVENDKNIKERLKISFAKLNQIMEIDEEKEKLKFKSANLLSKSKYYQDKFKEEYKIIGSSSKLKEMLEKVERIAKLPRPVLIIGERGTGKELIAAYIHNLSPRKNFPFITLNCAALPEGLLESELFGYEKGAFTDAKETKRGKFELADGGSLFLDEIGNMPLSFQKKILRVIEYQEFERISGTIPIRIDVRIIAATNCDLKEKIKKGEFIDDLYDRIAFDIISVPPLRERKEDIKELCYYFLNKFSQEVPGIAPREICEEVIELFTRYDWPGNIRELKFTIERSAYKCKKLKIEKEDLSGNFLEDAELPATFKEKSAQYEKQTLVNIAISANWNKRKISEILGLSYDQVRYLFKKYNLTRDKW